MDETISARIAHARDDIPWLLSQLARVEAELDTLKQIAYPICPKCGLENDRIVKQARCDRCGAVLCGAEEEEW